ncbi:MAG TPA: Smr/MutS family protein [Gemmatimonadales bacterium]|nr:Smr/MutS family protein [Gemmatimonadales bacterium]
MADALAELEFDAVLGQVAQLAAGPAGAARIRSRRPSGALAWIREELADVEELRRLVLDRRAPSPGAVPDLATTLARLRIEGSVLEGSALVEVRRLLGTARSLVTELTALAEEAPRAAGLRRPLPDKALERRLELSLDDAGELLDSASPALASARHDVRATRSRLIQRLEGILRNIEGQGEGTVTVRNGRYVIPVPRDSRSRPAGIIHDESASGATLYLEPSATLELGNALREAEARAERAALAVCRELTDLLRPVHGMLADLLEMCIQADDLAARARYAAQVGGQAPTVDVSGGPLVLRGARHPLLLARLPADEVVPFDLDMTDGRRTLLLSGPNTGGKTVLLKAVGVIAALVQSGIVPPTGAGSALPVFDGFFADIGDRQSIAASLSTFSAHVTVVRRILESAGSGALILLDEIGSGTDPAEGAALASAVLLSLTRRGAMTLATTHLGALKELATRSTGVANASLQFDGAALTPTFRLMQGIPGRSYGLAIARRLGVPEAVLADAESQVSDADRALDRLLAAVEQRQNEQEARAEELEARSVELEALNARLEVQREGQEVRERDLKTRARDAERDARSQARAFLLEARQKVEAAIQQARGATDEAAAREARRAIEEAARLEAEALKSGQAGRRAGGQEQVLEVGSRVRLESGTSGNVLEVRGDGKVLVGIGSMKLLMPADGLVPLTNDSQPGAGTARLPARPTATSSAAPIEIDLRGFTAEEAEAAVLHAIDEAVLAENPYLRIIHGKGTGVLRERVRQIVESDTRVARSVTAPANQGGSGVTIAEFVA